MRIIKTPWTTNLTAFAMILSVVLLPNFVRAWAPIKRIHTLNHNRPTLTQFRASSSPPTTSISLSTSNTGNLISLQKSIELFGKQDGDERVVFVDGSYYHKGNRNGRDEFESGPRIQGARYLDMEDIATSKELYPERNPKALYAMLPPPDLFAAAMDAFDIQNSDRVIIYGREGSIFTPRTWFLFRTMGHQKVHLMQASLEEWIEAGGPVDTTPTTVVRARDLDTTKSPQYQASDPADVCTMDDLLEFLDDVNEESIILDPRGSSFAKGYIPGARHIPYSSLVTTGNQLKLKSVDELKAIFEDAGVDVNSDKRIVCSCGSGVSACHLYLALQECGRTAETFVYDGSWNEWSKNPDAPKVIPSEANETR